MDRQFAQETIHGRSSLDELVLHFEFQQVRVKGLKGKRLIVPFGMALG